MASLRQHPRSPFWFACYTLPDGRRTQRSTKQTDRRRAQRIADQFEDATRRKLTEVQARRVLSSIYEIVNGEPLASLSVKKFFEDWVATAKASKSKSTGSAYEKVAKDFVASLGERCDVDMAQLSTADIVRFQQAMLARVSVTTSNNSIKILRVAFGQAVKSGFIDSNPATKVDTIRKKQNEANERRPFTLPELRKILALCGQEWRGMVLAGFYTGQRLGDIAKLTWQAVDLERGELCFVTAKTGRRQRLPIAKPLRDYLAALPASDDPKASLFPNSCKSKRLSNQFYDILVSAGLAKERSEANTDGTGEGRRKRRKTGGLSFHCLRHTTTSLLKVAGVSEIVAMDVVGHDSPEISRHYSHVDDGAKRAAIEKLPDLHSV